VVEPGAGSAAAAAKQTLRECALVARRARGAAWVGSHSRLVMAHLVAWHAYREAHTVMVYLAGAHEVQTQALIEDALRAGRRVVAPQSVPGNGDTAGRLVPRLVSGPEDVQGRGSLGLPEPDPERTVAVPPEDLDLVLVPGLAFDRAGRRLGRGRGFYDGFLAILPPGCVTCGVAFADQVVPEVPTEPHDRPVAHLATEDGVARCGP
jgi:5-formyltetrahydrofolate cyclo-ligase